MLSAAPRVRVAAQCFEGLKAYVDANNRIRLFRPEENMKRMASSAKRLCFTVNLQAELSKTRRSSEASHRTMKHRYCLCCIGAGSEGFLGVHRGADTRRQEMDSENERPLVVHSTDADRDDGLFAISISTVCVDVRRLRASILAVARRGTNDSIAVIRYFVSSYKKSNTSSGEIRARFESLCLR